MLLGTCSRPAMSEERRIEERRRWFQHIALMSTIIGVKGIAFIKA